MFYPKEFKARVKKAYPNFEDLHHALDSGSQVVGDYLYEHFTPQIPCSVILSATSLEALQAQVREIAEKNKLFEDWVTLRNAWYDNARDG